MRITKAELEKYGFCEGCDQCAYIRRYGYAQPGRNHSEKCRQQIMEAMGQTEEGKAKIDAYVDRLTKTIAEQME